MIAKFPRVVVWDHSKTHHFTVFVWRERGEVITLCHDCSDVIRLEMAQLETLRKVLQNDVDSQVVAWIENNG